MSQEEATKIYLEKFPLINNSYSDRIWKSKNGWNFRRTCDGGSFSKEDDFIHEIQVREDGTIYKSGNIIK